MCTDLKRLGEVPGLKRKTGIVSTKLISDDHTYQNGLMICLSWNETTFKVFTGGKFYL